jgi:hypothetical protein
MQNDIFTSLTHLADGDLVARVKALLASERGLTAVVIAHLAELDTRDVHLREGYPSLYLYCRDVLRLSEWEAYNRIEVARSARQFPLILDMLEDGSINLTAVRLLGPHLTPDNHIEVLAAARGKRKPELQQIVASLAPRADVPASVRRLPARSTAAPSPGPPRSAMETAASSEARKDILDPGPLAGSASALSASGDGQSPATGDDAALSRRASLPQPSSGVVVPLSPDRYKLQVTIREKRSRSSAWPRTCSGTGSRPATTPWSWTALSTLCSRSWRKGSSPLPPVRAMPRKASPAGGALPRR